MKRTILAILLVLLTVISVFGSLVEVESGDGGGSPAAAQEGDEEAAREFGRAVLGIIFEGEASLGPIEISIGESVTSLLCQCMRDDSCDETIQVLCDPIGTWWPQAERYIAPVTTVFTDPDVAICAAGVSGLVVETPPDVDWWDAPLMPRDPILSIEAIRWDEDGHYGYAIRYQFAADEDFDEDEYEKITFEVRGSATRSVIDLASLTPVESAADLPLAASFSSDELFSRACIRFDTPPIGLPREYCTAIVEVSR